MVCVCMCFCFVLFFSLFFFYFYRKTPSANRFTRNFVFIATKNRTDNRPTNEKHTLCASVWVRDINEYIHSKDNFISCICFFSRFFLDLLHSIFVWNEKKAATISCKYMYAGTLYFVCLLISFLEYSRMAKNNAINSPSSKERNKLKNRKNIRK